MQRYTTIYTIVDDFCKLLDQKQPYLILKNNKKKRNRTTVLSLSEMVSIVIFYYFSGYKYFKFYYEHEICRRLSHSFPNRPTYDRFIALMPRLFMPITLMFHILSGKSRRILCCRNTFLVCKK